jgi:recombination protein RecR
MDAMDALVDALQCLPGVGPKSAQRMVYQLLKSKRQRGLHLAHCLQDAMIKVQACEKCANYTEGALCRICSDPARADRTLCVVESAADIVAIEHSQTYKGCYFVLNGKISPLDGLGPEEIGLPKLRDRVEHENIEEVIIALPTSVETHATYHFIQKILAPYAVQLTQLAHGIPSGGDLEYLDGYTISSALKNRAALNA